MTIVATKERLGVKKAQKQEPLPTDLPGRIELVGATLYGKSWRRRLAVALGVSRSTLWQLHRGAGKRRRDVDGELIELLDCERDAASERSLQIAALRRRFMAIVRSA
jgi:hypothetical protein